MRCIIQGDRNNDVRAALKREKHYSDLSDAAFTPYRKLPIVREGRMVGLVNMRDVGSIALARRLDILERRGTQIFEVLNKKNNLTPKDEGGLTRSGVVVFKEISRLVDTVDPDGLEGIPNAGESPPVSIEQILAGARALSANARRARAEADALAAKEAGAEGV